MTLLGYVVLGYVVIVTNESRWAAYGGDWQRVLETEKTTY